MLSKYNETYVDYSLYLLTPNNSSSYIVSTTDTNLIKSVTWFSLQPTPHITENLTILNNWLIAKSVTWLRLQPTPPYYRKPNNTKQPAYCQISDLVQTIANPSILQKT